MKKLSSLAVILILLLLLVAACSSSNAGNSAKEDVEEEKVVITENTEITDSMTEEELKQIVEKVMEANLKFSEEENLDAYIKTLASEYNTEESRASIQELFDLFDLDYELVDIEILEISKESAMVKVTQKTIAKQITEGYQFSNHIVSATHNLENENGFFKVKSTITDQDSIQYLDENGNPL